MGPACLEVDRDQRAGGAARDHTRDKRRQGECDEHGVEGSGQADLCGEEKLADKADGLGPADPDEEDDR
jgi:hypothetical protein